MSKVIYKLEVFPEDIPVTGNVLASGDADLDKTAEAEVLSRLDNGDIWAWCTVKVTASVEGLGFEGCSYLGCCSYRDEADFTASGGYYKDMCNEALGDLIREISLLKEQLDKINIKELEI